MFVSGSIYDPSLLTPSSFYRPCLQQPEFSSYREKLFPTMNVSIVGTHTQLANSLFLSLFRLLAVSTESPRIEGVKREKKKSRRRWERAQKDYGCLKLICVRFSKAAGALLIETAVNVGFVLTLFLNFFAFQVFTNFLFALNFWFGVLYSIIKKLFIKEKFFFYLYVGKKIENVINIHKN